MNELSLQERALLMAQRELHRVRESEQQALGALNAARAAFDRAQTGKLLMDRISQQLAQLPPTCAFDTEKQRQLLPKELLESLPPLDKTTQPLTATPWARPDAPPPWTKVELKWTETGWQEQWQPVGAAV